MQKQIFFSYAVAPARAGDEEENAHIPERDVDPPHFTSIPPFLFPISFNHPNFAIAIAIAIGGDSTGPRSVSF